MILLFVKLLLAHLIGDFILQPTSWVLDKESKKIKSKYLYFHVLLHAVLIFVLVATSDFLWYGITIALLHGVIDLMKLSFQKKKTKRNWFIADQILHLLVLSVITLLYYKNDFDFSDFPNSIWIVVTSIILLTKPTSIIIKKHHFYMDTRK
jgi:protein-S-isoprenylcysteine O-methyltransferase Ste14